MRVSNPFHWKHYKRLILVPLVMLAVSLFFIFVWPKNTYGLDLKGGTLITVYTDAQPDAGLLKQKLAQFSSNVEIRTFSSPDGQNGLEIELAPSESLEAAGAAVRELDTVKGDYDRAAVDVGILESSVASGSAPPSQLEDARKKLAELDSKLLADSQALQKQLGLPQPPSPGALAAYQYARDEYSERQETYQGSVIAAVGEVVPVSSYSAREVGSSLSRFFFQKATEILVFSFLLSSLVVFVIFRSFLPSFAVVFGAVSDVVITLGIMALIGLPLSLPSFAALLMLIAFSLDTDVLLTVRVLKRSDGTPEERAFEAMKAGFMINIATVAAYGVLLVISMYLQIQTYFQIASVAVIGGIVDFVATWFGNAVLILHYYKRK